MTRISAGESGSGPDDDGSVARLGAAVVAVIPGGSGPE